MTNFGITYPGPPVRSLAHCRVFWLVAFFWWFGWYGVVCKTIIKLFNHPQIWCAGLKCCSLSIVSAHNFMDTQNVCVVDFYFSLFFFLFFLQTLLFLNWNFVFKWTDNLNYWFSHWPHAFGHFISLFTERTRVFIFQWNARKWLFRLRQINIILMVCWIFFSFILCFCFVLFSAMLDIVRVIH